MQKGSGRRSRAIALTDSGERVFVSGGDLKDFECLGTCD
jgi:hypothetical protein